MRINKISQITFLAMMIVVLTILSSSASLRISDFKEYHRLLAKNTAVNVSESISQFIMNRKRLMQIFAKENTDLIQKMINDPENEELNSSLELKIKSYFPRFFSYTISDVNGNPYHIDFEGYVGDLCVEDIKNYSKTKENLPRIHPNAFGYHYDLMSDFFIGDKEYIIFISFKADEIAKHLKNSQAVGHKTVLVYKENQQLLEITDAGARNKHFREDYRLSKNELGFLLFEKAVIGSSWSVYDFYEENLFSEYENKILASGFGIFLIFILVSSIFYSLVKREEKKRKKAEAIKSEFVTVVSHELRTPLTSIAGSIKLIENEVFGPINGDIKNYLNIASNNIDRLTKIVNDILDVKKMESGEFQLSRENISLVDVVEQSLQENSDYANNFKVKFDFLKPEKDYIVYADKDRLLQVMDNLLSNAVKYGAKEDCIKIYFKELDKSIRLNIEDHGQGIKEKNKDILFEKFTQSHSRDAEVVKGTGLGLNIVKNIIESHDGIISYETGKKKGTIFYILLPLVR